MSVILAYVKCQFHCLFRLECTYIEREYGKVVNISACKGSLFSDNFKITKEFYKIKR